MATIIKEKAPFPKSYRVINTKEDFGFENEVQIAFWADPSEEVALGLLKIISTSRSTLDEMEEEELRDMNTKFYEYVSQIILDTSIEGISFDSAEDAEAAFDHPQIDWGFWWRAIGLYIDKIMAEVGALKKTLRITREISNSGESESSKEQK